MRTGQQADNSSTRALSRALNPVMLVVIIYTGICPLVNVVCFCVSLGGAIRLPYALFFAYKFEIMQGYIKFEVGCLLVHGVAAKNEVSSMQHIKHLRMRKNKYIGVDAIFTSQTRVLVRDKTSTKIGTIKSLLRKGRPEIYQFAFKI